MVGGQVALHIVFPVDLGALKDLTPHRDIGARLLARNR
jgi:hypothetical protein